MCVDDNYFIFRPSVIGSVSNYFERALEDLVDLALADIDLPWQASAFEQN
jgi:hypothetical protein